MNDLDNQFKEYISNNKYFCDDQGRIKNKFVPILLNPVLDITLDAFYKGYPLNLIYSFLLDKNKIPSQICFNTFKKWFYNQRKKQSHAENKQESKNNITKQHEELKHKTNFLNISNTDKTDIQSATVNKKNVNKITTIDNSHNVIITSTDNIEIEEDENILFASYLDIINSKNSFDLSSSENSWKIVYNNLLEKKSRNEFKDQLFKIEDEDDIKILDSTRDRDYIYIPNRLRSLSPLSPRYPFMRPVNWLCYDEKGIIYEKRNQLPIPYEYSISIQCYSISEQPLSAIVPKDPLKFGKAGEYLDDFKLKAYFNNYYKKNNKYPRVHKLLAVENVL